MAGESTNRNGLPICAEKRLTAAEEVLLAVFTPGKARFPAIVLGSEAESLVDLFYDRPENRYRWLR